MNSFLLKTKKCDWWIIVSAVCLSFIGLASVYSSSVLSGDFSAFWRQLVFLVVSLAIMFIVSFFDYRGIKESSPFMLVLYIVLVLLLLGLFLFAPSIRGTRGWYKIGNLSFDPAEFAKLILIIILAKYFSYRHAELYKNRHIVFSGIYMAVLALLVFFKPDLGSAIIFFIIWFGMLLVSGIKFKQFIILLLIVLILAVVAWNFVLKDYQKERIISFMVPEYEPLGTGWNQRQARIAIGNGGLFGQGFGQGSQTQYGFVPEVKADFIFSAIGEEFGLITILVMLGLFALLFWRLTRTAFLARDNFSRLFCLGLGIWFLIQLVVNIGSNIGFLPVIGVPMPFVSAGGSSLLAIFIGLGIFQSIRKSMIS